MQIQMQMQMHLMPSHSFEVGQPFRSAGTEEWQCPPNGCLHQAQELWQARKMRNFITFLIKEFVGTRNWLPKAGAGPFGGRQPTIARKSHRLAITSCWTVFCANRSVQRPICATLLAMNWRQTMTWSFSPITASLIVKKGFWRKLAFWKIRFVEWRANGTQWWAGRIRAANGNCGAGAKKGGQFDDSLQDIQVCESMKTSTIQFSTHKHGDEFILDRLENGQIYAVQYTVYSQIDFI